jgi:hypothetical protein
MKELEDLAEKVKSELNLNYDIGSVKFVEEFIERQRNNFDGEQRNGLINSIGSFVGQCIIINYGGHWQVDQDTQSICVALDDKSKIFPFAKTAKQFENGLEDSVYSFYTIIPTVFEISPLTKFQERDNSQSPGRTMEPKKWWKFWRGK